MITSSPLESSKTETSLQINSFDKPTELNDVAAWSQLMLNLLFLKPGTYPSMPDMGIGIEQYQYEFLDDAIDELSAKIITQQQTYLPDIPLDNIQVSKYDNNGHPTLIILMNFTTSAGSQSSAIAFDTSKRNFLNFDISW